MALRTRAIRPPWPGASGPTVDLTKVVLGGTETTWSCNDGDDHLAMSGAMRPGQES